MRVLGDFGHSPSLTLVILVILSILSNQSKAWWSENWNVPHENLELHLSCIHVIHECHSEFILFVTMLINFLLFCVNAQRQLNISKQFVGWLPEGCTNCGSVMLSKYCSAWLNSRAYELLTQPMVCVWEQDYLFSWAMLEWVIGNRFTCLCFEHWPLNKVNIWFIFYYSHCNTIMTASCFILNHSR